MTAVLPVSLGNIGGKKRVRLDRDAASRSGNDDPNERPDHGGKFHAIGITHVVSLDNWPRSCRLVVQGSDKVVAPPPTSHNHSRPAKRRRVSPRARRSGAISEDEKIISTGRPSRRRASKGKSGRRVQLTDILNFDTQLEPHSPFYQPRGKRVGVKDSASRHADTVAPAARVARGRVGSAAW